MAHTGPYTITATLMSGKKIQSHRKTFPAAMRVFNEFGASMNVVHREITNPKGSVHPTPKAPDAL